MRQIDIEIKDERVISGGGVVAGAAGSHNDINLHITFLGGWDGLTKKVIWQSADGIRTIFPEVLGDAYKVVNKTNEYLVPIPVEAKKVDGKMSVSIKGYQTAEVTENSETVTVETMAVMTAKTDFIVLPSISDDGASNSVIPTADQLAQIDTYIAELQSNVSDIQGLIPEGTASDNQLTNKEYVDDGLDDKQDISGLVTTISSSSNDTEYPSARAVYTELDKKVDKVAGKSLIDNSEITRLANIESGAQVNLLDGVKLSVDGTASELTKTDKKVTIDIDTVPTNGSTHLLSSGGAYAAFSGKQDTLTFETTPTSSNKVATMADINSAVASVYRFKGSASVDDLNSGSGFVEGDIYNLTDSGTLNAGSVYVSTGDNVAWVGGTTNAWDNLGNGINLSNYYQKSETYSKTEANALLSDKVDVVSGKGLSTNDYTDTAKGVVNDVGSAFYFNKSGGRIDSVGLTGNIDFTAKAVDSTYAYAKTLKIKYGEGEMQASPADIVFPHYVSSGSDKTMQDYLDAKENISNKVTSISENSTDTQYPSAKCVYDIVGDVESALQLLRGGSST